MWAGSPSTTSVRAHQAVPKGISVPGGESGTPARVYYHSWEALV